MNALKKGFVMMLGAMLAVFIVIYGLILVGAFVDGFQAAQTEEQHSGN